MTLAGLMKAYILLMLRGYKALLSPMLPNACRFVPTCSEYAMEAIERYGAFRGGLKAMWRLLRCHPFAAGGYDPVILPEQPAGTPNVQPICCNPPLNVWVGQPCPPIADNHQLTTTSRLDVWRC
jgi:uncharacterized protein